MEPPQTEDKVQGTRCTLDFLRCILRLGRTYAELRLKWYN